MLVFFEIVCYYLIKQLAFTTYSEYFRSVYLTIRRIMAVNVLYGLYFHVKTVNILDNCRILIYVKAKTTKPIL